MYPPPLPPYTFPFGQAVFLACFLTADLPDVDRIPVAFKSQALGDGNTYQHIVMAVRRRKVDRETGEITFKWGAIGLSRRRELGGKSLTFDSLSGLIADYQSSYARVWHRLLAVYVGLEFGRDFLCQETIYWRVLRCPIAVEDKVGDGHDGGEGGEEGGEEVGGDAGGDGDEHGKGGGVGDSAGSVSEIGGGGWAATATRLDAYALNVKELENVICREGEGRFKPAFLDRFLPSLYTHTTEEGEEQKTKGVAGARSPRASPSKGGKTRRRSKLTKGSPNSSAASPSSKAAQLVNSPRRRGEGGGGGSKSGGKDCGKEPKEVKGGKKKGKKRVVSTGQRSKSSRLARTAANLLEKAAELRDSILDDDVNAVVHDDAIDDHRDGALFPSDDTDDVKEGHAECDGEDAAGAARAAGAAGSAGAVGGGDATVSWQQQQQQGYSSGGNTAVANAGAGGSDGSGDLDFATMGGAVFSENKEGFEAYTTNMGGGDGGDKADWAATAHRTDRADSPHARLVLPPSPLPTPSSPSATIANNGGGGPGPARATPPRLFGV